MSLPILVSLIDLSCQRVYSRCRLEQLLTLQTRHNKNFIGYQEGSDEELSYVEESRSSRNLRLSRADSFATMIYKFCCTTIYSFPSKGGPPSSHTQLFSFI